MFQNISQYIQIINMSINALKCPKNENARTKLKILGQQKQTFRTSPVSARGQKTGLKDQ